MRSDGTESARRPLVSIAIITYNSARYIQRCLSFVFEQTYQPLEVILIDNASGDESPTLLRQYEGHARVFYNRTNNGFAGGQNQAMEMAQGEWILTLNPDVRLSRDFVAQLVAAGEQDARTGTVCGKLLAMESDFAVPAQPVIDSTGIYFTRNLRHFDRGSKQPDTGAFDQPEWVFGATGAAALYRRAMIADVSLPGGGFFDPAFFAYREDADVAWRAQLLGWKCRYAPDAVAYHVRNVLPSNRDAVSALINMHSVKNRFLMRINNVTGRLYWRHLWAITGRDLLVVAACLVRERSSLPAFSYLLKHWRDALVNRRFILSRRGLGDAELERWFNNPDPARGRVQS